MDALHEAEAPELIDSGNIPIYDVHGLHDVEVIGGKSWFLYCDQRRTVEGKLYFEPAFYVRIPNETVGTGILLTLRNATHAIASPVQEAIREFLRRLRLH